MRIINDEIEITDTMANKYDIILLRSQQKLPPKYNAVMESLGIGLLMAILREKGFSVKLIDLLLNNDSPSNAVHKILNEKFDVIGISIGDRILSDKLLKTLKLLRAAGVKNHITLGGHFPSLACSRILKNVGEIDSIFVGEAEYSLPRFLDKIKDGSNWKTTRGMAFRGGKDVIVNPHQPLVSDLNELPFVNREQLSVYLQKKGVPAVYSSRGCYGKCSFCSIYCFYRRDDQPVWRCRAPENVIDEVELLVNKYRIKELMFCDDNFFGPGKKGKEQAMAIADEILRRKLKVYFAISCRANDVDEFIFRHLMKSGLRHVFIGIESFNQDTLKLYNKGISVEQNVKALSVINKLKLNTQIGFIMFHPYVTLPEIINNISYLDRTANLRLANIFSCLDVYHGTPIEKYLDERGLLVRNGWNISFKFVHKETRLVYRIIKRLFEYYYPVAFELSDMEDPITYEWRRPYNNNLKRADSKLLHGFEDRIERMCVNFLSRTILDITKERLISSRNVSNFWDNKLPEIDDLGHKIREMANDFICNFKDKLSYYKYSYSARTEDVLE